MGSADSISASGAGRAREFARGAEQRQYPAPAGDRGAGESHRGARDDAQHDEQEDEGCRARDRECTAPFRGQRRLERRRPGQQEAREEEGGVVPDVCPVVVQILDARPDRAQHELHQYQRYQRRVEPCRRHARGRWSAQEREEEGQPGHAEDEEVGEKPQMSPREALERGEEPGHELEEALVEGRGDAEPLRNHLAEALLQRGRDAQAGGAQVEAAAQLDVLHDGTEADDARGERHQQPRDPLSQEAGDAARPQRRDERPAGEQEEERHVPEADEAGDDEHAHRRLGVADVEERRRVEDLGAVEDEEQPGGADAEPVDVRTAS